MTDEELLRPKTECALTSEFVRDFVGLLGDKWTLLVVSAITKSPSGRARFTEIERMTKGISQRILAARLRSLESHCILKREVFSEVPVRVEYALTDLGREVLAQFETFAYSIIALSARMQLNRTVPQENVPTD